MISGSCATQEVFHTDGRDETVEMESEAKGSARKLLHFLAATCKKKKKNVIGPNLRLLKRKIKRCSKTSCFVSREVIKYDFSWSAQMKVLCFLTLDRRSVIVLLMGRAVQNNDSEITSCLSVTHHPLCLC